jgi:hypothetical protein
MAGLVYDEKQIYDYEVVTNTTLSTMVSGVESKLRGGWKLYGPLVADGTNFMQALVKLQDPHRRGGR